MYEIHWMGKLKSSPRLSLTMWMAIMQLAIWSTSTTDAFITAAENVTRSKAI